MRKLYIILIFVTVYVSNFSLNNRYIDLYNSMYLKEKISYSIFEKALTGYDKISKKNKDIIVIIDYTKPATEKRFYVLDLKNKKVLYETLVSHGKNSGINQTIAFSNTPNSYQSTLGFFLTDTTYSGEFGYSLRLKGLEPGINSNTEKRKIVIHGAEYVSYDFIKKNGFLGRTLGCPALPKEYTGPIIETIKNGTVLFVIGNDQEYLKNSPILKL
ncbi:MAG: murein L,D-transpeptidase catalytic domain family protein [Fusobacteriaceae bacterium]|nr:murein L,D-transpeptidase catalytic domain family protein [Fusobacteriaceae bacterium]MBP6323251.1 murein L,D-transpeptidase catalytic domain family protein [Fusobacteriaceae bacterium]MBP9510215.1 murein L,D-transpeptidase catalytic domain family protein [Fusobacteriaceae bacterium]